MDSSIRASDLQTFYNIGSFSTRDIGRGVLGSPASGMPAKGCCTALELKSMMPVTPRWALSACFNHMGPSLACLPVIFQSWVRHASLNRDDRVGRARRALRWRARRNRISFREAEDDKIIDVAILTKHQFTIDRDIFLVFAQIRLLDAPINAVSCCQMSEWVLTNISLRAQS